MAQAVVQAADVVTPPAAPVAGQAWIVGAGATAAWAGHDGSIAAWTPGGWRFAVPAEGFAVWTIADAGIARYVDGIWRIGARGAAISDPTGGSAIDIEARTAIDAILAVLRDGGLIAVK